MVAAIVAALPIVTGIAGIAIPAIKDLAPLFGSGNTKREGAAHLRLEEARINAKISAAYTMLEQSDLTSESRTLILALLKEDLIHTLRVMDMVGDLLQGKDDDAPPRR